MSRYFGFCLGIVLVVVILQMVGWDDRVVASDGTVGHGRIVERSGTQITLETEGRRRVFPEPQEVHEGLRTVFSRLAVAWDVAVVAAVLHLSSFIVMFLRWGVLLHGAKLDTSWLTVLRLGWVGQLLGSVLPGGVAAGDVAKAVYVARLHRTRKTRAVLTVFVDRLAALSMLVLIAAVAVLLVDSLGMVRNVVMSLLGVISLVVVLLFSRRLRDQSWLGRLVRRLPFQGIIKEAAAGVEMYRQGWRVMAGVSLLSVVSHLLLLLSAALYGNALGDPIPMIGVFACLPVAMIVSSVPGLPGGWGVGELAFLAMLSAVGVPAAQAVALSVTWRTLHTLLCLPAAFMLGHGRERIHVGALNVADEAA